jgi:hypothetical protein
MVASGWIWLAGGFDPPVKKLLRLTQSWPYLELEPLATSHYLAEFPPFRRNSPFPVLLICYKRER